MSSGNEIIQELTFEPQLSKLRKVLQEKYKADVVARKMAEAMEPVVDVGLKGLRSYIRQNHRGPTGNLLNGTIAKVVPYKESGNAVGLVGYRAVPGGYAAASKGTVKIGQNRAFHAGFLEFGTDPRRTKGPVASSFRRFGPFKMIGVYPPVKTRPAYPNAFFKRAKKGQTVSTGRVLPLEPIKNSFERSASSISSNAKKSIGKQLRITNGSIANLFPKA